MASLFTSDPLVALHGFLDDITAWGWAEAPARRVMFAGDLPRPPHLLPRALSPDVDAALMAAVVGLQDRFARVGLIVLRGTGLRIGELLDLELGCVVDYGPAGQWLRVPLGKLNSERSIPLDGVTLVAIADWTAHRGAQRALPHPRDGRLTDFLFVERGRRPGKARINRGLVDAGLTGHDEVSLHVTAHQLRHSYAPLHCVLSFAPDSAVELTMFQVLSYCIEDEPYRAASAHGWRYHGRLRGRSALPALRGELRSESGRGRRRDRGDHAA